MITVEMVGGPMDGEISDMPDDYPRAEILCPTDLSVMNLTKDDIYPVARTPVGVYRLRLDGYWPARRDNGFYLYDWGGTR